MKNILLITSLSILCLYGYSQNKRHTDHWGMRAIQTSDHCILPTDDLGCKNGHLWKQVGNDDWVDIGKVTDSCNCSQQEHLPDSAVNISDLSKKGNYGAGAVYFTIAITDSGIFLPNGFPSDYAGYKVDSVPKDGMGILYPNHLPEYFSKGKFRVKIYRVADSLALPKGSWSIGSIH